MTDKDNSIPGYVKIEREGDSLNSGSIHMKINRAGEEFFTALDMEDTCSWIRRFKDDHVRVSSFSEVSNSEDVSKDGKCKYMSTPNFPCYAEAIHTLREACENDENSPHPVFIKESGCRVYRPLMLAENLEA